MDIEDILRRLGTSGYGDILVRLVKENWKDGYEWGWEEGKGKGPSGVDEWTLKALEEKIIQLSAETESRLKGDLRQALIEGVKNREGVSELKKRVAKVFEDLEGWKTERVVRTEISQATHQGRNAAWIVTKVPYKMWWNPDVNSKRTAEDSKRFHGQIQRVEDAFVDPVEGKLVMTPPNRPQCRCGMRTVFELPKELVWIGGIMYDGRYVQKEASMHKSVDDSVMDLLKGGPGSGIKGHTTAPKQGFSHQFRDDDYDSTETMMDKVGARLAEKWDVSEEAVDKIRKEERQQIEGLSFEEKRRRVVVGLLRDWASSSGGSLPSVMAEHLKNKHGLSEGHRSFLHEGVKGWMDKNPEVRKGLENLADTMYAETQKWFKDRGIKEVTAYRGGFSDDSTKVLTSWSVSYGGARREDVRVNRKEVIPVKNILSTPATGFGTLYESEIVVIGAYDGDEVRKLLTTTILDGAFEKAWTDAAREKALEARRRKMKGEDFEELKRFKSMMEVSNPSEIREYCKGVLEQDKAVKDAVTSWYSDRGMAKLDWHATKVFGLDEENNSGKWGSEGNEKRVKDSVSGETFKNTLKLYIATQVWLDWMYPGEDTVTVYRGVDGKTWEKFKDGKLDEEIDFSCYNLSCWSTSASVAKSFLDSDGGIVVEAKVPKKQVLLSWMTGDSPYDKEMEITVMGKNFKGKLHDVRDKGWHETRRELGRTEYKDIVDDVPTEIDGYLDYDELESGEKEEYSPVMTKEMAQKNIDENISLSPEDKLVVAKLVRLDSLSEDEIRGLVNEYLLPRFDEFVTGMLKTHLNSDGSKTPLYDSEAENWKSLRALMQNESVSVVKQALREYTTWKAKGEYMFFSGADADAVKDVLEWSKVVYT